MQELLIELQKKFIRITKKEIEELRRYLFDQLYSSCIVFFKEVMKQSSDGEPQIDVFYGSEMGETVRIGTM